MTIKEYKEKFTKLFDEMQQEHGRIDSILLQNKKLENMVNYYTEYVDCEIRF